MSEKRLGIIMHGVTGRMGANQHLARSIAAIREQGGVRLADGTRIMPDPILVGRRPDALRALAHAHRLERTTTDLDAVLADKSYTVFFDAASTQLRPTILKKAIAAGIERNGVGSSVPLKSNSRRKRLRSVRVEFAPWLMARGLRRCCRLRRTWRNAEPLGVHIHLWQFPV